MPNETLSKLFHDLTHAQEKAIITPEFADISNNDLNIIDAIGLAEPRSMSAVARDLEVTVGTLTIAINHLVDKEYVLRSRSDKDRRIVLVSLSQKGVRAYHHRRQFHGEMILATLEHLDASQREGFLQALTDLHNFLANYQN